MAPGDCGISFTRGRGVIEGEDKEKEFKKKNQKTWTIGHGAESALGCFLAEV